MQYLIAISFFILGALIGSFLNVVILRLPRSEKLGGRSYCPHCKSQIADYDLIPIVSFLLLRGKCRNCKGPISPRYFLVELITGLTFAFISTQFSFAGYQEYLMLVKFLFAACVLLVVFIIDLEHFLILDNVLISAIIPLLLLNFFIDHFGGRGWFSLDSYLLGGLLAGFSAFAVFYLIWFVSRGKWMGFGDVKLVFLLGLIVGWPYIWLALFLAFALGSIVSIPLLLSKKKKLASKVPFGTFLSIATMVTLIYGKPILMWYLSLIGWQ